MLCHQPPVLLLHICLIDLLIEGVHIFKLPLFSHLDFLHFSLFLSLNILNYLLSIIYIFHLFDFFRYLFFLNLKCQPLHIHILCPELLSQLFIMFPLCQLLFLSHCFQVVLLVLHGLRITIVPVVVREYFIFNSRFMLVLMDFVKVMPSSLFHLLHLVLFHYSKVMIVFP